MNLEEEIYKFKLKYCATCSLDDNYIYLRLSALDNSIKGKDKQIKDCIKKLEADFKSLLLKYPELKKNGYKLLIEVKSAYKNSTRDEFNNLCEKYLFNDYSINDLLRGITKNKQKKLYVSSFDRLSRVFFNSLLFQLVRKFNNINLFTLSGEEMIFENNNKDVLEKDNLSQTMFVFSLMMFSSAASKHSEDMSYKIKKRVTKKGKVTISSKTGNKWGAAKTINNNMRKRIKERFKSFTAKEIREQSDIYQKVKGVKKKIAVNTILSIAREK